LDNLIKKEFANWINKLDKQTLSNVDNKLLNIIITNFDSLSPLGTAGGKRAKKLSDLILEFRDTISNQLQDNSTSQKAENYQTEDFSELEIGPFRGFVSQEQFIFDKKYTFIYGPNGSGKSSFFEGLEYALVGDISEATSKKIPIDSYIKNIEKKKSELPILYSIDSKGKKQVLVQNRDRYRFSLIEKNRIDNFARLSAKTPSEQKDRIANLFGLDAFSEFVDGFTDDFKSLPTNTPIADEFFAEIQRIDLKKQRLVEIEEELKKNITAINELINEVGKKDVIDKEKLKIFLNGSDEEIGKIKELIKKQTEEIPQDINIEIIDKNTNVINELYTSILNLDTDLNSFHKFSSDLNYKELYSAIASIGKIPDAEKTVCPACKTPIEQTTINPFINAQNELEKLHDLVTLQKNIPDNARDIEQKIRLLNKTIIEINNFLPKIGYDKQMTVVTEIIFTDIYSASIWLDKLVKEMTIIQNESSDYSEIKKFIVEYNVMLEQKRDEQDTIDTEIEKYTTYNIRLIEINTTENLLKDEINQINTEIDNFKKDNEQILKKIEVEKLQVEENIKFISSYNKLISLLKIYRNKLPLSLAAGLSEKVKEYYNIINDHDSEFEKFVNITIPSIPGEKIIIQFSDSNESYDALYVLSEGHIRILGLSILLAKAVMENLDFIIFDDIVNAIDDDHRSGIAELLMKNVDFNNRKQIVTCHGEMFIKLLEHKLGATESQKEVKHYRFYPSDMISNRGIIFSPGDSMHNLIRAQYFFERNELKNTAAKCRQAVENIADNIWRKIVKQMNENLPVVMRSPDAKPDLSSVIDGLIKKIGKFGKNSDLYTHLSDLKSNYQWLLLNKGIHEEESLPEFERYGISKLLELIKTIEKDSNCFDIQTTIVNAKTKGEQ
jgi:DNA repair exonuclease SbcCD ATPase subunit